MASRGNTPAPSQALGVTALANGPLAVGFALTGIHVEEIADPRDTEEALARCLQEDRWAIVILQESLAHSLPARVREAVLRRKEPPLVVVSPSFDTEESGADRYVAEVVRPAIGYEIRLE